MKKIFATIMVVVVMTLSGCGGMNYRKTNVNIFSGGSTNIDARGATNTTGVDQKSATDLGKAVEMAKDYIETNALKVFNTVKDGKDLIIPVVKKEADIEEVD